ncbi:DUF982 domain-containing protein [Mesorhizobium sp. M7A.F.Ca.US.002.01.1.1]|uniref:DUF982 domain-containing protein n=1 Tax=Mesorhizobium sp. M7A.F.Ca.US.002.01.1.1 TaxID=2496700 RepID=UPI000FD363B6|nr:DUF982 domain-containing protein [Mesorhizobium sp. M7A.F.Ca.US.002.01.1.1]RVA10632.1 DUF982 domain-containing protein [Mesorhizobium sp. M7A.F.Ca.US.002.01.1.1]
MAIHWFNPPVPVKGERSGMISNVNNVEAAAEHLIRWTNKGPHWRRAVKCCVATIEGKATAQEARRCFRLAAIEEGMLLAAYELDN